jgi:catechol 2,3-dioxygenase-like lactoylglutathione lyase family enzyme
MTTPNPIRVVAFAFTGYPVTDLARARSFYEGLFGLKPGAVWEGNGKGWIEYDLGDGTLAITNSGGDQWTPSSSGPSIAFEVADFPATVAQLRAANVKFVVEPVEFPSCHLAVVSDPDGNRLTIHKKKAAA